MHHGRPWHLQQAEPQDQKLSRLPHSTARAFFFLFYNCHSIAKVGEGVGVTLKILVMTS